MQHSAQKAQEGRMAQAYEQILLRIEEHTAVLTLNRPERMNALGVRIVDELLAALEEVEADTRVRALILSAAGERAFCSGVDLKERRALDEAGRWNHNRALNEAIARLARLQFPTIAAVGGLALGGGFELTLACDLRLAAEGASFGLPEVGLGIIPGAGGTQRLPRLVGPARAKELIFTARRIAAEEALSWGLVSQLLPAAQVLAATIARQSPLAVAYAKAAIEMGLELPLEQGLRYETAAIRATLASPDYQAGLAAFAERREPQFDPLPAHRIV
jgi:enoyl-CoA hydratase/carnithine racemase